MSQQIVTEAEIGEAIDQVLAENRVVLFMKGTPEQPACGFSYRTVQALQGAGTDFVGINILPDPRIRQVLSGKSGWPTIPQLFVDGELIGGADIVAEMYQSGELHEALGLEAAQAQATEPEAAAVEPPPLGIENRL
jgi:monothiol glutaredoxin